MEVDCIVYLADDFLVVAEVKKARRGSVFKSNTVAIPKYPSFHKMHRDILEHKMYK